MAAQPRAAVARHDLRCCAFPGLLDGPAQGNLASDEQGWSHAFSIIADYRLGASRSIIVRPHKPGLARMKRLGIGLLCAVGGYFVGAVAGYFLIEWFSSNVYDRSLEAAMTSIFFWGPLGAALAFVVGFIWGGRRSTSAPTA